jgi:hypothetical protein
MDDKAWGDSSDMPLIFPERDCARIAPACLEALEQLFKRYPPVRHATEFVGGGDLHGTAASWREEALDYARHGRPNSAILWADSTGVPRDELITLLMLLGGAPHED